MHNNKAKHVYATDPGISTSSLASTTIVEKLTDTVLFMIEPWTSTRHINLVFYYGISDCFTKPTKIGILGYQFVWVSWEQVNQKWFYTGHF